MKNVLMIEDDLNILELVEIHLNDIHCKTTKTISGEDGIRLALESDF